MRWKLFLPLCLLLLALTQVSKVSAQGFNVASTYDIGDAQAKSGDIIVNAGSSGLIRSNVSYDPRLFGVLTDAPLLVLREASGSARPIIRAGDTPVNVNDSNGAIKKGDFVTSSPVIGQGMRATQSGFSVGIALADADYSGPSVTAEGKTFKSGSVNLAIRIEYAELNTARNNIRLLEQINASLFSTVKDPEKAVLLIRYVIAGLIAMLAFAIGFYSVTRSIGKGVEAVGRNPLARRTILISIGLQILITIAIGIATIVLVFIVIRV